MLCGYTFFCHCRFTQRKRRNAFRRAVSLGTDPRIQSPVTTDPAGDTRGNRVALLAL